MNSNICTKQQNRKNLHTSKQQRIFKIAKAKKKKKKPWNLCKHIFEGTKQKKLSMFVWLQS
jgi:hypothetical protein